ncbi:MAG TPA: His/Gly/Thr/Pro-type tRNA ligase C-terminal domain-containing protein [Polyangiaceae bacterium]|nr:His/Gly/Thr/Pro-type tRNA ligase C-terminal domain-containing protein [Polyangiaceae bacterium]
MVTVSEKQAEYAEEALRFLTDRGLRVNADFGADKLGAKIRNARLMRVPYIVVIGDKEAADRTVSPRSRDLDKNLEAMPLEAFADKLLAEAEPPRLEKAPTEG